jgi:hypothetical protein
MVSLPRFAFHGLIALSLIPGIPSTYGQRRNATLGVAAQVAGSIDATVVEGGVVSQQVFGSSSATLAIPVSGDGSFTLTVRKANHSSASYSVLATVAGPGPSQPSDVDGVELSGSEQRLVRSAESFETAYNHTFSIRKSNSAQNTPGPVLIIRIVCNSK